MHTFILYFHIKKNAESRHICFSTTTLPVPSDSSRPQGGEKRQIRTRIYVNRMLYEILTQDLRLQDIS